MRCQRNCTADAPVQATGPAASGAQLSVRSTDPQSGDVTDGSVDYFDFEWGQAVFYDERSMEPVLFPCENSCADACHGGSGGENENGNGSENENESRNRNGDENGGENGGMGGCIENMPDQDDGNLYEILQE